MKDNCNDDEKGHLKTSLMSGLNKRVWCYDSTKEDFLNEKQKVLGAIDNLVCRC